MEHLRKSEIAEVPSVEKSGRSQTRGNDSTQVNSRRRYCKMHARSQVSNIKDLIFPSNDICKLRMKRERRMCCTAVGDEEKGNDSSLQPLRTPDKTRDGNAVKTAVAAYSLGKKHRPVLAELEKRSCESKLTSKNNQDFEEGLNARKEFGDNPKRRTSISSLKASHLAHLKTIRKRGNANTRRKGLRSQYDKLDRFNPKLPRPFSYSERKPKSTPGTRADSGNSCFIDVSLASPRTASLSLAQTSHTSISVSFSESEASSNSSLSPRTFPSTSSPTRSNTPFVQSAFSRKQQPVKRNNSPTPQHATSSISKIICNRGCKKGHHHFGHQKQGKHCSKFDSTHGREIDLEPIDKITRDLEETFVGVAEQEFEIDFRKRKSGNHLLFLEDFTVNDMKLKRWQHQRLVLTSRRFETTPPHRGITGNYEQDVEVGYVPPWKRGTGGSLTIRDLYSLQHVLSDTENGTVIAGRRRSDGIRVAIKRIAKSGTIRWGIMDGKMVPLELSLICQVNEVLIATFKGIPCTLRSFSLAVTSRQVRYSGVVEIIEWHETTEAFIMVMLRPYPSIDLYDHVTKQKLLQESVAKRIIKQVVLAVSHCQRMGVFHRDVKLENILFNPVTLETVLIDFGCGDYSHQGPYTEFAGTLEYYPPEWFLVKKYYAQSATVWSIGVLLYSLLCGNMPFSSSKDITAKTLTKFPVKISATAKHLIGETLKKNPRERILLKSILSHPWLITSGSNAGMRKTSV